MKTIPIPVTDRNGSIATINQSLPVPLFLFFLFMCESILGTTIQLSVEAMCFQMSKKKEVQERRDRDQIITALRARRFTGIETLQMGLDLTNIALEVAGERQHEKD